MINLRGVISKTFASNSGCTPLLLLYFCAALVGRALEYHVGEPF